MRLGDLLQFAATGFARRKGRTALTLLGVIVGSLALMLIVALGEGLRGQIVRQFTRGESLRQVLVRAGQPRTKRAARLQEADAIDSDIGDARRERLRRALLRRRGGPRPVSGVRLLPDSIRELEALPGVERVDPLVIEQAELTIEEHEYPRATVMAVRPGDPRMTSRIVVGRGLAGEAGHEALVHELLLYRMGFHSREDQERLLGTDLIVRPQMRSSGGMLSMVAQFQSLLDLTDEEQQVVDGIVDRFGGRSEEEPREGRYRLVGIIGEPEDEEASLFEAAALSQADVILPSADAFSLYFSSSFNRSLGYLGALVLVERPERVAAVSAAIEERGFRSISVARILDNFETALSIVTLVVSLLSAVALLVAALGIANTMAMSVLERTREVGIMKAVGARDGDIRWLFLVEGGLIGLVGGGVGWGMAWLLSLPVEAIGRAILRQQTAEVVHGPLVSFPVWLPAATIGIAVIVATLAAVWPARRAARIDPVEALRHE